MTFISNIFEDLLSMSNKSIALTSMSTNGYTEESTMYIYIDIY